MRTPNDRLLRTALRTDAIGCAIFSAGVIVVLANGDPWLAQLDVSTDFVLMVGLAAMVGVPLLWSLSSRREIARGRVWPVIAANLAWAIFCIIALATGWVQPSKIGAIIIVAQAIITAAIAELEWIALRGVGVQRESAM